MSYDLEIPPMKKFDIQGKEPTKRTEQVPILGLFTISRTVYNPVPDGKIDNFEFKNALIEIANSSDKVYGKDPKYATIKERAKLFELINGYKIKKVIDSEKTFKEEITNAIAYLQAKMGDNKGFQTYY